MLYRAKERAFANGFCHQGSLAQCVIILVDYREEQSEFLQVKSGKNNIHILVYVNLFEYMSL